MSAFGGKADMGRTAACNIRLCSQGLLMDVVIVGGGIGGLTLALAIHASASTSRIRVFEAAPDVRALGVGINLGPHAVKELSALGLEDALVAVACTPQDYAFFTRHGQL